MNKLSINRASSKQDETFARELTKANMADLTERHWGSWRSGVFLTYYPTWDNFLIYLGPTPVGYLAVKAKGEELELVNLQLQASHRSTGIGSWALTTLIAMYAASGCTYLRDKVFKDNPALAFFKSYGCVIVDEDEHFMTVQKQI